MRKGAKNVSARMVPEEPSIPRILREIYFPKSFLTLPIVASFVQVMYTQTKKVLKRIPSTIYGIRLSTLMAFIR